MRLPQISFIPRWLRFFSKNGRPKTYHLAGRKPAPGGSALFVWVAVALLVANLGVGFTLRKDYRVSVAPEELYLLREALVFFPDSARFVSRVLEISDNVGVPPAWLMAIMHHESKFNPRATNYRGSGATGLIQFMPPTLADLNARLGVSYFVHEIKTMDPLRQLDLVEGFFLMQIDRGGKFQSLGDMYTAVLFPRARHRPLDHVLFVRGSVSYSQNRGLDTDRDGAVTLRDLYRRMNQKYPYANKQKP